jgi:hypothetical protein
MSSWSRSSTKTARLLNHGLLYTSWKAHNINQPRFHLTDVVLAPQSLIETWSCRPWGRTQCWRAWAFVRPSLRPLQYTWGDQLTETRTMALNICHFFSSRLLQSGGHSHCFSQYLHKMALGEILCPIMPHEIFPEKSSYQVAACNTTNGILERIYCIS